MRRSVLVTGAGSGIGRSTALHLAGLGFHTLAAVHTDDEVASIEEAARSLGVAIEALVLDVGAEEARRRAVDGRTLYGLVNNAGYFNAGAVADVPAVEALRQLEVMVVAPMRLAQLALPAMRAAGEGRIVNITSTITLTSVAMTGWYQASKHALAAVSDALRMEVADDGVEVVQIEPGGFDTQIWDGAEQDLLRRRERSADPTAYDRGLQILRRLRGRVGSPGQVAEVVGDVLTTGRPKAVYRVGADTVVPTATRYVLPRAARDRLVRSVLKL